MTVINALEDILEHHGIKGMKWGVRHDNKHPSSRHNEMDHVKLENYKGKTYFISEHNMDGKMLTPRVPDNYFTKHGYEDSKTNRVSFAPSVRNALMGLSQNVTGKKFYVHEPIGKHDIYKPNNKAVPDAHITGELWIKDPVKLKTVGEILATSDAGKPGEKFKYGEHTAELYESNYKWTKGHSDGNVQHGTNKEVMFMDKLDDLLQHSGVKGMKWKHHKPKHHNIFDFLKPYENILIKDIRSGVKLFQKVAHIIKRFENRVISALHQPGQKHNDKKSKPKKNKPNEHASKKTHGKSHKSTKKKTAKHHGKKTHNKHGKKSTAHKSHGKTSSGNSGNVANAKHHKLSSKIANTKLSSRSGKQAIVTNANELDLILKKFGLSGKALHKHISNTSLQNKN